VCSGTLLFHTCFLSLTACGFPLKAILPSNSSSRPVLNICIKRCRTESHLPCCVFLLILFCHSATNINQSLTTSSTIPLISGCLNLETTRKMYVIINERNVRLMLRFLLTLVSQDCNTGGPPSHAPIAPACRLRMERENQLAMARCRARPANGREIRSVITLAACACARLDELYWGQLILF
jgi:hypothetical protein